MITINKKVMLMLLSSTFLGFSASAANKEKEVPISTIISTGSKPASLEKPSNLWFMLDDSGSMGRTDKMFFRSKKFPENIFKEKSNLSRREMDKYWRKGWRCRWRGSRSRGYCYLRETQWKTRLSVSAFKEGDPQWLYLIRMGFIDYVPSMTYEKPKKPDGTEMPTPKDGHYYLDPYYDAITVKNDDNFKSIPENRRDIDNNTYATLQLQQGTTPFPTRECGKDENCRIWKSYYSTRMKVLKASLSIALNAEKNQQHLEKLRVGYRSLHNNISTQSIREQVLPVLPLYGETTQASKQKIIKWLYSLTPQYSTPTRGVVAEMLHDITLASQSSKKENPFLVKPNKKTSSENPVLSCRRNYMLVMTDGEWNNELNTDVRNLLTSANLNVAQLTGADIPTPFRTTRNGTYAFNSNYIVNAVIDDLSLSDIAYTAWINDMDKNDKNNTLIKKFAYEDDKKTIKTNPSAPSGKEQYWHPHNDPATWQHMNTYTMGFGLQNGNIDVNNNIDLSSNRNLNIHSSRVFNNNGWYIGDRQRIVNAPDDLANAAIAGRGHYYDTQTAADLMNAFDDLLGNTGSIVTEQGIKGSGGATGSSQAAGNAHFLTLYNDRTVTENETHTTGGELIRRNLFDGTEANQSACFTSTPQQPKFGDLCDTPAWEAAKLLSKEGQWSKRTIVSSQRSTDKSGKTTYQQINFNHDKLSQESKNRLLMKTNDSSPSSHKLLTQIVKDKDSKLNDEETQLLALMNYIKGAPDHEIQEGSNASDQRIFRNRDAYPFRNLQNNTITTGRNILGIIMRSSPVYSDIPRISNLHSRKQSDDYVNFVERYIWPRNQNTCASNSNCIQRDLVNLVFVGSNDGMLHAFRATDGQEVFAYVPNAVYDNLAKLTESESISFVDGNITIEPINVSEGGSAEATTWQRLLTGTMGAGAKGLYALDITDPSQTDHLVKWEYSDFESIHHQQRNNVKNPRSNVGNIIAKPGVVQLADGTWAVVVGNGYNSDSGKAALLVINADTGETIQELVVEADGFTDSHLPNGMGPAYFIAFAGKNSETAAFTDRAYAGDLQGNLWVFDFTNSSINGGITVASGNNTVAPLFSATYQEGNRTFRQPITTRPLVKVHPRKMGYLVHFGTGALFEEDDLSTQVNNSIYAVWDDWVESGSGNGSGLPNPRTGNVVRRDHLNELEFTQLAGETITTNDETSGTVRTLSKDNQLTNWAFGRTTTFDKNNQRGWFIDLLPKERAWQNAYETFGSNDVIAIGYNTVRYDKDGDHNDDLSCETVSSSVQSWQLAFNPDDGAQNLPMFGTLDINGDGINNKNDLEKKQNNTDSLATSGHQKSGIQYNNSITSIHGAPNTLDENGNGAGSKMCTYLKDTSENSAGKVTSRQICRSSRNASWREINENLDEKEN